MATRKTKNSENERLDANSIEKAIDLLENKGTKKAACEILNIAYNTTRLGNIIEKYKADKAKEAAMRAEKKGKPATKAEIQFIIQGYLEGSTVDHLATSIYRSANFVNNVLSNCGVPKRNVPHDYFNPEMVPEEAVREEFRIGEIVYSMRYDSIARVDGEWRKGIYRLFLLSEKWQQFCYQPAEELASLDHIRALGVNI